MAPTHFGSKRNRSPLPADRERARFEWMSSRRSCGGRDRGPAYPAPAVGRVRRPRNCCAPDSVPGSVSRRRPGKSSGFRRRTSSSYRIFFMRGVLHRRRGGGCGAERGAQRRLTRPSGKLPRGGCSPPRLRGISRGRYDGALRDRSGRAESRAWGTGAKIGRIGYARFRAAVEVLFVTRSSVDGRCNRRGRDATGWRLRLLSFRPRRCTCGGRRARRPASVRLVPAGPRRPPSTLRPAVVNIRTVTRFRAKAGPGRGP